MTPAIELLIGATVSGEEARFLKQLFADFAGQSVLILANFDVSNASRSRQVDFVVVTDSHTELLELKNFNGPVFGSDNGPWKLKSFSGHLVEYQGENPWTQASQAKFVLSDAMRAFSHGGPAPAPLNQAFFREFDASVCIYPQIAPGSQVTAGNFKAWVRGYQDCLTSIRSRPISSNWRIPEWREFATGALKLRPATLAEAIDPHVSAALDRLKGHRTRLRQSLAGIPPLPPGDHEEYGEALVRRLHQPENTLLLGASGCGKSFHLRHLVAQLSERGQIPILVQARRYHAQDFSAFVSQNLAPYYRGALKDFFGACSLAGQTPVLVVDGLNECPRADLDDFGHGIQSFLTYTGGRLVASAHESNEFPRPDTIKMTIRMAPLTLEEKKTIYRYYSGASSNIDHFCAAFTNAYDLSLAGKSHAANPQKISRASLYDHYVRLNVPKQHEALALGLLRAFAAALEESFSFSVSRDGFDRLAEAFLEQQGATLLALDEIRQSRLLQVSDDNVSFEHELLQVYFRAERLRRVYDDSNELEKQLPRPIHQELLEFVVARFPNTEDVMRLLRTSTDVAAVQRMVQGSAGECVQKILASECTALLDLAERDLGNISLELQSISRGDGKRSVAWSSVTGNRTWTEFELLLLDALFKNISAEPWQEKLLTFYFETEQALRDAAARVAEQERFLMKAVWRETVRCVALLIGGRPALPALTLLTSARRLEFCSRHRDAAVQIFEKIYNHVRVDPTRELSLALLIAGTQGLCFAGLPVDLDRCMEVLHWSFSSASPLTKMDALELFRRLSWHSSTEDPTRRAQIKTELQKLDVSDPFVNTDIIEVLGAYDAIDPPVPFETATEEFQRVAEPNEVFEEEIARNLALRPDYSRAELIADYAYRAIGNIFEDVYLGVYSQAYEALSAEEKTKVLIAAGMKREAYGFATDWLLAALSRQHDQRSLPVFLRYARKIDQHSPFLYEAATAFVISMVACAEFLTEAPAYEGEATSQDQAWSILGRIVFWHTRKRTDPTTASVHIAALWSEASQVVAPAIPDALHQLSHGMTSHLLPEPVDLVSSYPSEVRHVLQEAIKRRDEISTLFGQFPQQHKERIQSTLKLLGLVGNDATASLLEELVNDQTFGKEALDAIFQIRRSASARS